MGYSRASSQSLRRASKHLDMPGFYRRRFDLFDIIQLVLQSSNGFLLLTLFTVRYEHQTATYSGLYSASLLSIAQAMRAVLFARATAAILV